MVGSSSGVADDRTGHAVAAAPPAAELLARDRKDLDAGLGEARVRRLVPLVADDDAGGHGNDVVAVVPLLALGLEGVAAGRHELELVKPRASRTSSRNERSEISPVTPSSPPGRNRI